MNKFSLPNETVCAISSPPGIGGIAVIRTSGKDAVLIPASIFSKSLFSFLTISFLYGTIFEGNKEIDHVIVD